MINGKTAVLVVEDDPHLKKLVNERLTDEGFAVLEASSTSEALAIIDGPAVDFLFTDVLLRGRANGLELARHVSSWHSEIRIILTSAQLIFQASISLQIFRTCRSLIRFQLCPK